MKFTYFSILIAAQLVPAQGTRLLRHPALSRDSVAFEYAGRSVDRRANRRRRPAPDVYSRR